jgi:hypothetical protein
MIKPKKGRTLVLDSADFHLDTYKEFEGILNMLAKSLLSYTSTSC